MVKEMIKERKSEKKITEGNHSDQREKMNNSISRKFSTTSNLSVHTENQNVAWHCTMTASYKIF